MGEQRLSGREPMERIAGAEAAGGAAGLLAVGVVVDGQGRVLLLDSARQPGSYALLTVPVRPEESPARALVRGFEERFGGDGVRLREAGPLLALDTEEPGGGAPARLLFLFDAGPLSAEESALLTGGAGGAAGAPGVRFAAPEELAALLPQVEAARVATALTSRRLGRIAHLERGAHHARVPGPSGLLSYPAYIAERPKTLTAASSLFTDAQGRVLMVKPNYLAPGIWLMPGGSIESDEDETPRQAARRESREEIGLDIEPGALLSVDWTINAHRPPTIHFTFDGGVLTEAQLAAVRLQEEELTEWRCWSRGEIAERLPEQMGSRILASLATRDAGAGAVEMVNGRPVAAK